MNFPTNLSCVQFKINKNQFGKYGLPLLNEKEFAKKLNQHILNEFTLKQNMNSNKLKKYINQYGQEFLRDALAQIPSSIDKSSFDEHNIYTKFVGDYFETFAEFFLKTFNNDSRFGVKDYEPVIIEEDYGVDGKGMCYNDVDGRNKCVVQVKYRVNTMDEIEYGALSNTFAQGVKEFDIDPHTDNNIILFTCCSGANYIAHKILKNNLFVVNHNAINKELNNLEFWQKFSNCF